MRNFLLALVALSLIPVIWFMGIKGQTFAEMLEEIGIRREGEQ